MRKGFFYLFLMSFLLPGNVLFAGDREAKIDSIRQLVNAGEGDLEANYHAIGKIFYMSNNRDSAAAYFHACLIIAQANHDRHAEIRNILMLANTYKRNQLDNSRDLAYQARALALDLDDPLVLADAFSLLANIQNDYSNYPLSNRLADSSLYYLALIPENKRDKDYFLQMSRIIGTQAINAQEMGDFKLAAEFVMEQARIGEENDFTMQKLSAYVSLANIFLQIDDYDRSKEYMYKSLDLSYTTGNDSHVSMCLGNLGTFFQEIEQYDSSEFYINKALEISLKNGNVRSVGLKKNNLGMVKILNGKNDEGIRLLEEAIVIAEDLPYPRLKASALDNITEGYFKAGRVEEALEASLELIELAKEIGSNYSLVSGYESLSAAYEKKGQYKLALEAHQQYVREKDSLLNKEHVEIIEELETRYQTEKKDRQIEEMDQVAKIKDLKIRNRNQLLIGLGGTMLVLAILGFILYKQRMLREERKVMAARQRLLRAQINPHFFFNALSSIQTYFLTEQNGPKAALYLSKFARLMRMVLENSSEEYITLEEEVETLQFYLELQKMRFGDRFNFEIEVSDELEQDEISIPPMFAQPFIENALEHGLKHKSDGGGFIRISFSRDGNVVVLRIDDNGVGRQVSAGINAENRKEHKSRATQITRDRIYLLNKQTHQKIQMKITDLLDELKNSKGTRVELLLPFQSV